MVDVPTRGEFEALEARMTAAESHHHEFILDRLDAHQIRLDNQGRRITALEEVPPVVQPPGGLEPREPFVIEGVSDQVIRDFRVDMTAGDWAVELRNCHNVLVEDFQCHGGGIQVVGGSNVTIGPGLVSRDVAGRDGWSDAESGVRFLGHQRGSLLGSVVAYADNNVRVEASSDILLDGNFTYNPRGPMPRGQHFQTWPYNSQRSRNITIRNHYSLTDFLDPGEFGTFQEDAFNFGHAENTLVENVLNEMHGPGMGSASGTGMIFEGGTGTVRGFTAVGQTNHGWSVSGGAVVELEDTLAFFDGIGGAYIEGAGNTAGVVRQAADATFGDGVRLYGTKTPTDRYGWFWKSGDATVINYGASVRLPYESPEAQAELAAIVRPPIPEVGFVLP